MKIKDYLLACVSEEAGEIVQVVGKSHRFGLLDIKPSAENTNWEELRKEVHDLLAVYEMLCEELQPQGTLNFWDTALIEAKKKKVRHYMEYSARRGRLGWVAWLRVRLNGRGK